MEEDDLKRMNKQIQSYFGFVNRKRLVDGSNGSFIKISDEFKHYFYDLTDDGWEYFSGNSDFVTSFDFKRQVKLDNIEEEVNELIDIMSTIRDRLSDDGFKSKFIIFVNDLAQQVTNPNDYSLPLYKFTGVGEKDGVLKYYKNGKYSSDEYAYVKIQYRII